MTRPRSLVDRYAVKVPLTAGLALILYALIVASGCEPAVAVYRTSAPQGIPRPASSVQVYMDEASAPPRYTELGMILANTHVFLPANFNFDTHIALALQRQRNGNQRDSEVFGALVREASRLGADAVIIKSFARHDVNLTISAVAIRTE